ncbi:MAG: preprotein translocase subunit SecE [Lachnospiraceae bacterium]|nr:preprotein translocase subunit SecE [Lachnospiraceae bacterium]MBQ2317113.1 preprotein translocase subunit SecE [Lachnospiraceae bacterium]MBQ2578135.1 preprotein translocase subunit SecE [Lachnospiraceae bacterium]MBQ4373583.1 preprotein translocase subunit SecE [Lachnospiraceae bacterium]MBR0428641.1 preprotein translocase subunit SecE [Lachnospiraceae bacterium]
MTTKEKKSFADRLDGLKAEFGKIFWPDGKMVFRQSTATIVVSVIVALLIVFFDMIIKLGVDFLVRL